MVKIEKKAALAFFSILIGKKVFLNFQVNTIGIYQGYRVIKKNVAICVII